MGLNVCVYGPTIDETGNVSKASARSFPFLKCTPVFYFVCFSWWPIISASLCLKSSVFFLDSWVYVGIEFLVDSYCSNLRKLSPCLPASMFFLVEKSAVKFTVSHLQSWFFIFPNSFQYFFLESWSSAVLMIAWVFSLDFLFFFFLEVCSSWIWGLMFLLSFGKSFSNILSTSFPLLSETPITLC